MTDSISLTQLQAAREQFPDADIKKGSTSTKLEYIKNKKSQAECSRSNVVIIRDNEAKFETGKGSENVKYVISVNVSVNDPSRDESLEALQDVITEFLNNIHQNI